MAARILLSNDDGLDAPGLGAFAEALETVGEVWAVAPDRERSATSHSISLHRPLRIQERKPRWIAVDGTPTDCVYLALNHILPGPPDLVVSGINFGPNLGNDVLYSGTVAAAMEGGLFGFPAIAVSLRVDGSSQTDLQAAYAMTAEVGASIAQAVLENPPPLGVILNVNVPAKPPQPLKGIKLCRLGYTDWSASVVVREDPRGRDYHWIGGERGGFGAISDSDDEAMAHGCVSVTPIHYDLTDWRSFSYVRNLRVEALGHSRDDLGEGPLTYPPHPKNNDPSP